LGVPTLTAADVPPDTAAVAGWHLEGGDLTFVTRIKDCRNHATGESYRTIPPDEGGWCLIQQLSRALPDELLSRPGSGAESLKHSLNSSVVALRCGERKPRHFPRGAVRLGFAHQIETTRTFTKHGICDVRSRIEDDDACTLIRRRCLQRQLDDEKMGWSYAVTLSLWQIFKL
jgi:putative transposase